VARIERGESRVGEADALTEATQKLVARYPDDPWSSVEPARAQKGGNPGKFDPEEDRFLLCAVHLYGYGSWETIRAAIRTSPIFANDYLFRAASVSDIEKRCIALMKRADEENKRLEAESGGQAEKDRKMEAKLKKAEEDWLKEKAAAEAKVAAAEAVFRAKEKEMKDWENKLKEFKAGNLKRYTPSGPQGKVTLDIPKEDLELLMVLIEEIGKAGQGPNMDSLR